MPWVGLEATASVSERAKTVHALDRAATVIGSVNKIAVLYAFIVVVAAVVCISDWGGMTVWLNKNSGRMFEEDVVVSFKQLSHHS
jgi:hypothetical protein